MSEIRPIDANKLLKKCIEGDGNDKFTEGYNFAVREISAYITLAPTVEPELRKGQWSEMICYKEHGIEMADYECTNCGGEITKQRGDTPKYCEHCGADMREEGEQEWQE